MVQGQGAAPEGHDFLNGVDTVSQRPASALGEGPGRRRLTRTGVVWDFSG